ncbi:MAG: 30S ribosomal protein S6 [Clostridiales bacterium]|nr:30S ribosomal protein S6 [Clostridiales bacterium]
MNKYEVMYVLDAALEDQARQDVISRFSSVVENNGGKVERVDEWGKRRLAYPINYKTEGYYVLMYMSAPSELPRELERNFKISDACIRYLVTRLEGEIPAKREPLKPYAPREAAPAEETAEAAEPAKEAPAQPAEAVEAAEAAAETVVDATEESQTEIE